MREAIAQAELSRGRTHPNPIVGALVVKKGRVISRGHHEKAGGPHAEVAALRAAGARARGADLFVTLEPCNHQGRTPPCTEAILAAGIARVFVGTRDPNRHVRGGGAERLRAAGVEVELGVLGAECDAANEPWLKFITTGRPWVALKAASTLDGKLATATGDSRWVTGAASRFRVHQLRNQLDAVLVGIGTVLADDPLLNVRLGGEKAIVGTPTTVIAAATIAPGAASSAVSRDPIRVIVDSRARTPLQSRFFSQRSLAPTLVAVSRKAPAARRRALEKKGAQLLLCESDAQGRVDLANLLDQLGARGITSLLVEGGAAIHGSFLQAQLWDELYLFLAPKLAGESALTWAAFEGPRAMCNALELAPREIDIASCAPDILVRARPKR